MATTVRKVEYFALAVPDKAGEGHRVLEALAKEGVNLLAFSGFPTGEGKAQVDVVPESARAFTDAAAKLKLRPRKPKRCFLVQGDDDRAGAVATVLGRLAAQKIPIIAAQAFSVGGGRWGMIVFVSPARFEKAAAALGA
jgi:hypothetical protein